MEKQAKLQDQICFLWKMKEMIENLKSDRENSAETNSTGRHATLGRTAVWPSDGC